MSSAGTSDSLNKEESDTVEQATEEKEKNDTANGSEGGENDEEEEDEENNSDEKKEKSLIVEGKREKKKVERLCLMSVVKKEPVLTEGKGQKLYDIERVKYFLKKKKCEELRILHRLLFNRQGPVNMIKRNIGQFNGFPFETGSEQYKKKEDMLKKIFKKDLKKICDVLDLEKSGLNSELISKIMKFLMDPKSTGKPLPKSKSKPAKGGKKKRGKKKRSSSGSARKSKSGKSNVILTDESSSEEEKKDKEESSGDDKESEEEEVEDEEDEEPPKKVSKKEKGKSKAAPKNKKASKSSNIKKADSSTNKAADSFKKKKAIQSESEDDSSDDEPLIKKVTKPPTDEGLRDTIKKLLAETNLEDVTMKQIFKKVNESYPNCDLLSKKKFIKATVKELIS